MRHIITLIATTGIALTTLGTADIAKATTVALIVETAIAAPIADEPTLTNPDWLRSTSPPSKATASSGNTRPSS